jgi:hypothetical protein
VSAVEKDAPNRFKVIVQNATNTFECTSKEECKALVANLFSRMKYHRGEHAVVGDGVSVAFVDSAFPVKKPVSPVASPTKQPVPGDAPLAAVGCGGQSGVCVLQ